MIDQPLISVCVPLFNKAATVEGSLRLVMAYDSAPMEILVFDNGSTDASSDIVARLAGEDKRIRHVRIEHTVMIQESWRLALLHGRGELLKLHSADDELDPGFFAAMIPPLRQSPDIGYAMCAESVVMRGISVDPTAMIRWYARVNEITRQIIAASQRRDRARMLMAQCATENYLGNIYKVVVRRSCLPMARWNMVTRAYPLPTSYPDWDFLLRLMLNYRGHFVDQPLSHYLITPDSPIFRIIADVPMRVADLHQRLLMVLTALADPELAELRASLSPEELQVLFNDASKRLESLVNLTLSISPRN